MCDGFGLIVDKNLDIHFIEPDDEGDISHSEILSRLAWRDNQDTYIRPFVRVEFPKWTPESFRFDEMDTLPGWVEEHREEIVNRCIDLLRHNCQPVWQVYTDACEAASVARNKINDPFWEEFCRERDDAWERLDQDTYCAERAAAVDAAWKKYHVAAKSADEAYYQVHDAAHTEMLAKFAAIKGYVPPKPKNPRDEIPF